MPDIIADRPRTPVIALFWDRESGNLNHLILISLSSRARGAPLRGATLATRASCLEVRCSVAATRC